MRDAVGLSRPQSLQREGSVGQVFVQRREEFLSLKTMSQSEESNS